MATYQVMVSVRGHEMEDALHLGLADRPVGWTILRRFKSGVGYLLLLDGDAADGAAAEQRARDAVAGLLAASALPGVVAAARVVREVPGGPIRPGRRRGR